MLTLLALDSLNGEGLDEESAFTFKPHCFSITVSPPHTNLQAQTVKDTDAPCVPAVMLHYCAFQGPVLQGEKCFLYLLCLCFMYYLCEKYYKPITAQCYIADCVSWAPRLTLMDLRTNWTYELCRGFTVD